LALKLKTLQGAKTMLVITRRPNESIVIDCKGTTEMVEVLVLSMRGRQVRLGIKAPPEVKVHRHEIYQRNQKAQLFLPVEPIGE
jgi:carbon storage regulator